MNIAVINIFEHVSCYTYIGVSRVCVLIDRVQNTLLQNMVSWQIKYFKLKESEKWHVQEGTSPETHVRCSPYAQRKGTSLSPEFPEDFDRAGPYRPVSAVLRCLPRDLQRG